jgi:two-component system, OmpR family, response regulator MtrA
VAPETPLTSAREGLTTILIIEDDPSVALMLTDVLQAEAYTVAHAIDGGAGKALLDKVDPDLILLDLMLPDTDGLVLCSDLKARTNAPIIICSATNRKRDAVLGLKLGADDFVSKPFDVEELLTRIQAVLRRRPQLPGQHAGPGATADQLASLAVAGSENETAAQPAPVHAGTGSVTATGSAAMDDPPPTWRVGNLLVDHARRLVLLGTKQLALTPIEYRLLTVLAGRPNQVLSRRDLAQGVWGYDDAGISRSIDVHLHRLRTKIKTAAEEASVTAPQLVGVRGFGYRLDVIDDD